MREENFTVVEFQKFLSVLNECMDGYLFLLDIKNDIYYISERATERFAIPSDCFGDTSNTFRSFIHKDDIEWLLEDIGKLKRGEEDAHNLDYRWLGKDGSSIWINCCGRSVKDENGVPIYMIGCVDEIGKKQKADNNSGLLEGPIGEDRLDAMFSKEKGFCLHLGIDNFREINESHGLDYGNFILRAVADCISDALSPDQELYRVVADEYMIIDYKRTAEYDADVLYSRIRGNIERFIEENAYDVVFTLSAGIVSARDLINLNYEQALKLTEFALSKAKKTGKNHKYIFIEKDYQNFVRERKIFRSIKESISAGFEGFEVYFQPIVKVEDIKKPYSAEALLRYRMKNGEAISPNEMIPIMEESGLILPVGKWVLDQAMQFCKIRQQTDPKFRVNVNVSYVQLLHGTFVEDLFQLLYKHQLSSFSIIIELTESGRIENSPQINMLWGVLKKSRVMIALDDFGTGFSNLMYISEMTPNVIKLDRSFTVKALTNSFEKILMTHTIQLIHSLGLKVCVEGIEDLESLQEICELGPDYVQGYFYSRPCSVKEFLRRF